MFAVLWALQLGYQESALEKRSLDFIYILTEAMLIIALLSETAEDFTDCDWSIVVNWEVSIKMDGILNTSNIK